MSPLLVTWVWGAAPAGAASGSDAIAASDAAARRCATRRNGPARAGSAEGVRVGWGCSVLQHEDEGDLVGLAETPQVDERVVDARRRHAARRELEPEAARERLLVAVEHVAAPERDLE